MHPFRQQLPSATTPEDYSVPSVNQDRDSDLRSLRHFRSGEMVWCRIEPPLPLGADEIGWWPAVIQDYRIDHHKQSATPHSNWYRIRLFGVTAHYLRQEESLLPWLSYRPPPTLQRMVRDTPRVGMKEAFSFHPMPDPLNVSWNDAEEDSDNSRSSRTTSAKHDIGQISTTYFLALFVASKIVRYWTATDRWVFEGKVEEGQEPFEEVRFQGIWWGSERLWAGDMVRIRPPLKELIDEDLLQPSAMAETRGVFVRINSFYLEDEVTHEGSSEQRPMFAGAIFELAEAESSDISFGPRETSPIYPFPTPPTGFKWRMITPSIYHEAHFYLTEIAGRYYPGLVPSRRLAPMLNANTLRDYLRSPNPGDFTGPLLALGGFIPGRSNYLDPKQWKPNRTAMLKSAYEAGVRKVFPDQETGDLGDDFMVELKEDDEKEDSLSEEESDGEEHTEDAGVEDDVEKLSISTVKSD
ncbi:hypothetical protein FRC02_003283 [Tulasnella sp. 418]|nr:hypothetical protein FRC02_003283 [Tulasnella sp. 418]